MFREVTNADRAEWARESLDAFPAADNDDETNIHDLIVDLLHLARRECGVKDVHAFVASCARAHDVEVAEDDEGEPPPPRAAADADDEANDEAEA